MEKQLIKDKYNQDEIKNQDDSLVVWYNELLNKNESQLTKLDINRMIRQNVLIDLALNQAILELIKNPFDGELTNGDILEHVLMLDEKVLQTKASDFNKIIKKAEQDINSFPWWYPEEKDEYLELLKKLKKTINSK